jgi:hypothetical protein
MGLSKGQEGKTIPERKNAISSKILAIQNDNE